MNYEELLKRARSAVPEAKAEGRFEIPSAIVVAVKRTTIIKNFAEMAKNIRRDQKHFAKFLSKELAVPVTVNGPELVLNGKVPGSIVNQRVREYVAEYVVCKECGKPDTQLKTEGGIAIIKCEACGARRTFKIVR